MRLPQVLIIGDSISMGYTELVAQLLASKADVHRPEGNCASTVEGQEHLSSWLGPATWDVIHFNWGLHDLKYMGPKGENLADPLDPDSRQKVPPALYEKNLTTLVESLGMTNARLVWCNTTPVPAGADGRVPGDAAKYNAIAEPIMHSRGIGIDDLFGCAAPRLRAIQQPRNVHFTEGGYEILATHVAACIEETMRIKHES
jgi:hypothetical protein